MSKILTNYSNAWRFFILCAEILQHTWHLKITFMRLCQTPTLRMSCSLSAESRKATLCAWHSESEMDTLPMTNNPECIATIDVVTLYANGLRPFALYLIASTWHDPNHSNSLKSAVEQIVLNLFRLVLRAHPSHIAANWHWSITGSIHPRTLAAVSWAAKAWFKSRLQLGSLRMIVPEE